MRETSTVEKIVMIVLFVIFLAMIIIAQKTVSMKNLGIEIVGLIGLLTLLFYYNRKHKQGEMKDGRVIFTAYR